MLFNNKVNEMITFKNVGELDFAGAMTFGVSAKMHDNPIGQFGTGLKYAVAILLRTGHTVTAWSGTTKYEFGLQDLEFRGQDFKTVTMNGEKLGFTTHLGAHWAMWHAYRELLCNALDEEGAVVTDDPDQYSPTTGLTLIQVVGKDIEEVHTMRGHWFIHNRRPDMTMTGVGVHLDLPNPGIFLKGVLVHELENSKASYDFTYPLDLTEDRGLRYNFQPMQVLSREVCRTEDPGVIALLTVQDGVKERWEAGINPTGQLNSTFREIAEEVLKNPQALFYDNIRDWLRNKGMDDMYDMHDPSPLEQIMWERAVGFLTELNLYAEYPVLFVKDLGRGVHARADRKNKRVIIAAGCFDQGARYLASTLLEEIIHLQTGYGDESRELQTRLFDLIIKMGEQQLGKPL